MSSSVNTRGLVPQLRFPEFREAGEWKNKDLRKVAAILKKKAGSKKYTLMSITAGVGLVSQLEKFGREIAGAQYKNYLVIEKNDFAYNKSATKEYPEGFIGMYSGSTPGAVPNSIFTCFRVDASVVSPKYLDYLFFGNLHGKWLKKFITVGARAHGSLNINDDDLLALPVPLPQGDHSLLEQQKIADCLTSLDELITLEAQQLDTLKTHKKGLMQQLFPAEGETLPKLRFPEFRDAGGWEEKRLGDVGNVRMCKRILKEQTSPRGDIPFYKIGTFGGVPDAYISRDIFDNFRKNYPFPKNGAVLISAAGTIGRTVRYNGELAYFQDSNIVWLDNSEKLIADNFLFYLYQLIDWSPSVGAIQRLYNENILAAQVKFPSIPEQQKIADCLTSLDDLITAQTQKIAAFKTHKKGLMQQLFPVLDEVRA